MCYDSDQIALAESLKRMELSQNPKGKDKLSHTKGYHEAVMDEARRLRRISKTKKKNDSATVGGKLNILGSLPQLIN
jgi:hypothetical protein